MRIPEVHARHAASVEVFVTERPYISRGIDELEELAGVIESRPEVIALLVAELKHRKNPRARQLLSQLEDLGGHENSAASVLNRTSSARHSPISGFGKELPAGYPEPPPISAVEHTALEERYESLRKTFTLQGELLARWGMTPALPLDLQELVFEHWRQRLAGSRNFSGRSLTALAEDRERIAREREAFGDANPTSQSEEGVADTWGLPEEDL